MPTEVLPDGHEWWRIARPEGTDPLDPGFAAERGGRWNPPQGFPALYLNEDMVTARLNLRAFVSGWPDEPENLRDDTGSVLVGATLPGEQRLVGVGFAAPAVGRRAPEGAGRELAWFPATSRSRARRRARLSFERWFWG